MPESEIVRNEVWSPTRFPWYGVGRAIGLFVVVLGIAAIHAGCRAIDRSPPLPTQPAVLARSRFGQVIQDGVGYGGVRIGMTAEELSRAWGPTIDARNTEQAYNVRLSRLDTGETIVVYLKDEKVQSIQFIDSRRSGETPLRTSQGVEMGDPIDRVRTVYGDPERENEVLSSYVSRGIAFGRDSPREYAHDPRRVYRIFVFEKAPSPGSSNVVPR